MAVIMPLYGDDILGNTRGIPSKKCLDSYPDRYDYCYYSEPGIPVCINIRHP